MPEVQLALIHIATVILWQRDAAKTEELNRASSSLKHAALHASIRMKQTHNAQIKLPTVLTNGSIVLPSRKSLNAKTVLLTNTAVKHVKIWKNKTVHPQTLHQEILRVNLKQVPLAMIKMVNADKWLPNMTVISHSSEQHKATKF
jgi:hypothetical protein